MYAFPSNSEKQADLWPLHGYGPWASELRGKDPGKEKYSVSF